MKTQQGKKEFNVGPVIDDHIIEDQREKQYCDSDECYKDRLSELFQSCFPVYFPVGPDKHVEQQPEQGDDDNSQVEFKVEENCIEVAENLVVDSIFPVNKKQGPGNHCSNHVCRDIFDYL